MTSMDFVITPVKRKDGSLALRVVHEGKTNEYDSATINIFSGSLVWSRTRTVKK
jgi:hypothetical protein